MSYETNVLPWPVDRTSDIDSPYTRLVLLLSCYLRSHLTPAWAATQLNCRLYRLRFAGLGLDDTWNSNDRWIRLKACHLQTMPGSAFGNFFAHKFVR